MGDFKPLPRDRHENICSAGSSVTVFLNPVNSGLTDGSWQAVTLPAGVECKSVMIQIHNGSLTDFSSFASSPPGFHFSTTGSAGMDFIQCVGSVAVDVAGAAGAVIGYVRAAAGNVCSVMVLS